MEKKYVKIEHELSVNNKTLEEIKEVFENNEDMITDINVLTNIKEALSVKKAMKKSREEFMNKVKESLKDFDEKYKKLEDTIKIYENKALENIIENKTVKTKIKIEMDEKTGARNEIVTKETVTNIPKGMGIKFSEGKEKIKYLEDLIVDDKYYKKELKKTEVKKAVKEGLLPKEVIEKTKGDPSIVLVPQTLIEYIEKKEKENEND